MRAIDQSIIFATTLFIACGAQQAGPHVVPGNQTDIDVIADEDMQLLEECHNFQFPEATFSAQNENILYTNVSEVGDGLFLDLNLTKFVSVYGVKVVGSNEVSNDKLLHVAKMLGLALDTDGNGKPDSPDVHEHLVRNHAILFLLESRERIEQLMDIENLSSGFPILLKYCPFAFDFEEAAKINPGQPTNPSSCADVAHADRSLAFALDHLIGRAFGPMFSMDAHRKIEIIFEQVVKSRNFDINQTLCPREMVRECGTVMFVSWAASSFLDFDRCWCEQQKVIPQCSSGQLKKDHPELSSLLATVLPKIIVSTIGPTL